MAIDQANGGRGSSCSFSPALEYNAAFPILYLDNNFAVAMVVLAVWHRGFTSELDAFSLECSFLLG